MTNADDDLDLWIYGPRSRTLRDVGSPDYIAATVLDVDGEEFLALVYEPLLAVDEESPCLPVNWKDTAPHELTGRLPRAYAPKCGHRASTSRKACQNVVSQFGQACPWHRSCDEQDTVRRAATVRP